MKNLRDLGELPNGCHLYVADNEEVGGRIYFTDECGPPHEIWITALTAPSTLMAALVAEERFNYLERNEHRQDQK